MHSTTLETNFNFNFLIKYVPPLILVRVDTICPFDSTQNVSALRQPLRHMALEHQRQPLGYGFCCRVERSASPEMALLSLVRFAAVACKEM
jgi:hypothetical protein